jgi:hypothetical protein
MSTLELKHDGRPIVIEQDEATGAVTIRCALRDVDESGRTQPVIIHLTENVEVVVPRPGVMPGILDPTHEWAVTRVELMDGEVRAMLWDHGIIEHAAESLVVTLVPAQLTATLPVQ